MYYWRISKYNPKNRNAVGKYTIDEWTSFSDIGNDFNGKKLSYEEYLKIENSYIEAIIKFMNCSHIDKVYLNQLEAYDDDLSENMKFFMSEGEALLENIPEIIRGILREKIWCKLESENFYVHFGYDYIMYIGNDYNCDEVIQKIENIGLFLENYQSPYL